MAYRDVQNSFTFGELDPKLISRTDFEGYYKGAQTARNVLVQPQGGLIRRFGQNYIFTVVDVDDANEPVTNSDEVNGHIFQYSPTKLFLIIARPNDRTGTPGVAFDIYLNNVYQTRQTTTDYTIAQIDELYMISSQDRVLILHESVQPKQLVRGINDSTWSLSTITFDNKPTYDFSSIDGTTYRGATDTFTPSATSGTGVTLTAANAVYTAGHVGGLFVGGGGILRITAVNAGGTVATGDTVEDFASTAAIKGVNSLLLESMWGNYTGGTPAGKNRGWPSRGEFFQNRLVLSRTLVLRNINSLSNSADFYNFDDSENLDINSFSIAIGTDGNDEVVDVIGSRALVILGISGIYSSSLFIDQPITPGNAFLNEQEKAGADDVRAQFMDNQILFVDANKQKVNSALYDLTSGVVNVIDVSVFSPQVVNQPVSTSVYRPSDNNGSYLLVANANGSMGVFQSLREQSVQAWTSGDTQGTYEDFYSRHATAYALVKREVGTGVTTAGVIDNVYIGNPDFESFTDITTAASSGATDVTIFSQENEYLLIGHSAPFYRLALTLNTVASTSVTPTFEYLDKFGAWVEFTPTDGTSGFTSAGTISWDLDTDTQDWRPMDISQKVLATQNRPLPLGARLPSDSLVGTTRKFWIRIRRTATTVNTVPIEDTLLVNTAKRLHIEQLSFDTYMDATETTTSDVNGLVTGLAHLAGLQVFAYVNGIPSGPYFVNSSGQITVDTASATVVVGIDYKPMIVPMPIVGRQFYGQNMYNPKQIKGCFVDYYESLGIYLNGAEIPTLSLNNFVLDQAPYPITDFTELSTMTGWDPRARIELTQEMPQPMNIIGIGYKVELS